jgi:hypothetical protein
MSDFNESEHPRVGNGTFTEKGQSAPEATLAAARDPFAATETVTGYSVDENGDLQAASADPVDGSLLASLEATIGSSDLQVLNCGGNWVCVTGAQPADAEPNLVLSQVALALGLRGDDGASYVQVTGKAVFLTVDRDNTLTSLTPRKEKLLIPLFWDAKQRVDEAR